MNLPDRGDDEFRDFKTFIDAVKGAVSLGHPGSFEWAEALAKLGYAEKLNLPFFPR